MFYTENNNDSKPQVDIYLYDGSFYGFLSAAFDAWGNFRTFENIRAIDAKTSDFGMFDNSINVITDEMKALRLCEGIKNKISNEFLQRIYDVFLSDGAKKEKIIFLCLRVAFKLGLMVDSALTNDDVAAFINLEKSFCRETQRMYGFTRFSQLVGDIMFSEIGTTFNQLYKLSPFFLDRMPGVKWIIFDSVRNMASICDGTKWTTVNDFDISELKFSKDELYFEETWKDYLQALTIQERKNPKLQRQLMPIKYRKYITEFSEMKYKYLE